MYTAVVSQLSNSGTGTQDFTHGGSWQPKFAIFQWSRANTSADAFQEHMSTGYGFCDGTNQRCIAVSSEDNQARGDSGRVASNNSVIFALNPTGTVTATDAIASFSSWLSNGVQINWTDAPAAQFYVTVLLVGGDDVTDIAIGSLAVTTGASATLSSLSWQPENGIFLCGGITTENAGASHAIMSVGAYDGTNQWTQGYLTQDNPVTMITKQNYQHDRVVDVPTTAGATDGYSTIAWTSTGFTLTNTDTYSASFPVYYLVWRGGTFTCGNATEPASTQQQTITTNEDVKAVMLFGVDSGTAGWQNGAMWTSGMATATGSQYVDVFEDTNGVADSIVVSRHDTNQLYLNITSNATATSSTLDDEAAFYSKSSTNFLVDWTNIGQARPYRYVAFGGTITITDTNTLIYDIRQELTDTNTLKHDIRNELTDTNTLIHDIRQELTDANTLIYDIQSQVVDDNTLIFDVRNELTDTNTLIFDIRQELVDINTIIYDIEALTSITKDLTLLYDIRQELTDANTLIHDIRQELTDTNTLIHDIRNEFTDTNTLIYDIDYNFVVKLQTYTANTTTGDQDLTFSADPAFTPKAAIVWWSRATNTVDTFAECATIGMGFTDGTTSICNVITSEDNQDTTDTAGSTSASAIIRTLPLTGVVEAQDSNATFVQWLSNGMRINWDDAPSTAFKLHVLFIGGGNNLNVKVGTFTAPAENGMQDITAPNFQSDGVVFLCGASLSTFTSTVYNFPTFSVGGADSATTECGVGVTYEDNRTTSDTWQVQTRDDFSIIGMTATTGGFSTGANYETRLSNGFRVNWLGTNGTQVVGYIAFNGCSIAVGGDTEPGSTGNQTITTASPVKAVMILGVDTLTIGNSAAGSVISVGCGTASDMATVVAEDVDASNFSVSVSRYETDSIYLNITANATASSSTIDDEASLNSVSSTGFTLNWSNIGNARPFSYITFGEPVIKSELTDTNTLIYDIRQTVTDTNTLIYEIIGQIVREAHIHYDITDIPLSSYIPATFHDDLTYHIIYSSHLTSITDINTLIYDIRNELTDANTLIYDVRNEVTDTNTLIYDIRQELTDTNTLIYDILQELIDTNTLIYDIRNELTDTNTLIFDISNELVDTNTFIYDITGQVVDTNTLIYDIIAEVVDTNTFIYDIRNELTDTNTLIYDVRNEITDTNILIYDIRNELEDTNTFIHDIRQELTDTNTILYDIRQEVTDTNTLIHDIRQELTDTNTLLHDIRNELTDTNTLIYDIRQELVDINTIIYDIEGATGIVIKALNLLYDVREELVDTNTLIFDIRNELTDANTLLHDIRNELTDINTFLYDVRQETIDTNTLIFDIRNELIDTNTLVYDIRNDITDINTLIYDITGQVIDINTLIYDIRNEFTDTNTFVYDIRNDISNTNTLIYDIIGQVTTPLTLLYDIISQIIKSNTFIYDIRNEITTDTKTFIYDIISQVVNTNTILYDIRNEFIDTNTLIFNIEALFGTVVMGNDLSNKEVLELANAVIDMLENEWSA